MTPSPLDLDVAIIGGGPGGLAAALALTRAVKGIRVKVDFLLLLYSKEKDPSILSNAFLAVFMPRDGQRCLS